ncbi:NAD(P)H-binding protein [Pediococcus argentinicus]|uniref:NAD(P)H-binding protein n=1 Tax=Pediococcus argentinicus TaxID=480391 RepID=UPI00338EA004
MMTNVLIIGATGGMGTFTTQNLLKETDYKITVFVRTPTKLPADISENGRVTVVQGDATKLVDLKSAMDNQDIVYANLGPWLKTEMANSIIEAMRQKELHRLIWIGCLGVDDEVPGKFGEWNKDTLVPDGYLATETGAVRLIEASDLNYTIIRPSWLSDEDEVDYEITRQGELLTGTEVSRKSVADFVTKLIQDPNQYEKESIGLNKPGTDGDKPSWY